jgi:hypothetical protein
MQKIFSVLLMLITISPFVSAQYKKDGTPDMRYRANTTLYSTPSVYAPTPTVRYQNAYVKDNGTYVESHYKTNNNNTNVDNFSTTRNINPYTNTTGSRAQDYSSRAYNYGQGQTIQTGPNGGQYYVNSNGNKVYVPKRY